MTPRFRWIATAGMCVVAAACSREPIAAPAPARITALPRELSAAEQHLIDADNRFTFKLFRELAARESPDSNLFVSPLSMAMALAMTYNGAAGATADGMAGALELDGMPRDAMNGSYQSLIGLLRALDARVTFDIANSIWYDVAYSFAPSFLETNRTYFDAEVRALSFGDAGAAKTINGWVNDQTRGKIPTIVPDPVPEDIVMYLINAIYFKGDWTQRFDKSLTRSAPFFLRDGSTGTALMMAHGKKVDARVLVDSDIGVLDLPYGGGAFSMTIVVPREPAGIDSLVAALTQTRWDAWIAGLDSAALEVFLPKFRQSYAPESLEVVLRALGMTPAFCDESGVDFSGMGRSDLCISVVAHKAFVDVNEEGTEAAAATAVGIGLTSVGPPSRFVVDRPFVFAIRENLSGTILFLGRVLKPVAP
jgi:serine protease inhibitor